MDDETKLAALELMLGTSNSVEALAKKMATPETKTVTRTVSILQAKVVKQPLQQSPAFVLNRRYQINETSKLL